MTSKKILVVDDSEFDRNLLVKALEQKGGYQMIQAESGDRCLEIIANEPVGLVLMDIMMPGKFGTQVLVKIREQFNPIELPIIMVTSKGDTADVIGCLQSGANDYITKPVNFEVALSRISTHLRLADLSREMARLKERAALDAMVITYNHEINNPLAVALGCLNAPLLKDEAAVEKLKAALWRVADIVKKIREVSEQNEIEYQEYTESTKMIKVR